MTGRERVLCALSGGTPDKVPYMYGSMDGSIIEAIIDRPSDLPVIDGHTRWNPVLWISIS